MDLETFTHSIIAFEYHILNLSVLDYYLLYTEFVTRRLSIIPLLNLPQDVRKEETYKMKTTLTSLKIA